MRSTQAELIADKQRESRNGKGTAQTREGGVEGEGRDRGG